MEPYHPTLWRTCRALANEKRLRCLKVVMSEPGLTVGEVAARLAVAENHACEYLRALQARGLIEARRQSRWVRYVPEPDPLVPNARPLMSALRAAFEKGAHKEADMIRVFTAFTHPRRIVIVRQLKRACALGFEDLVRATGISPQALYRHLDKLADRGLVSQSRDGWRLAPGADRLSDALVKLASVSESCGEGIGSSHTSRDVRKPNGG